MPVVSRTLDFTKLKKEERLLLRINDKARIVIQYFFRIFANETVALNITVALFKI